MKINKIINFNNQDIKPKKLNIKSSEPIYEIIGINKDSQIISYGEKTMKQFIYDEMLQEDGEPILLTMDDVIKNMDIFSNYSHYYKKIK